MLGVPLHPTFGAMGAPGWVPEDPSKGRDTKWGGFLRPHGGRLPFWRGASGKHLKSVSGKHLKSSFGGPKIKNERGPKNKIGRVKIGI